MRNRRAQLDLGERERGRGLHIGFEPGFIVRVVFDEVDHSRVRVRVVEPRKRSGKIVNALADERTGTVIVEQ